MYGVTLIITLVIVGGVIAYIGDKIGMKVGRKKLSLFGMRPKHTSILVTIITGFVIAAASIGVLTAVSEDVRTALFHMKEIQEALATSEERYQAAESRVQEVRDQLAVEEEKAEALAARIEEQTRQIEEKTKQFNELNEELQEVAAAKASAEKELLAVKEEMAKVAEQYEKVRADYEKAQAELKATLGQLEEQKKRVQNLEEIGQKLAGNVDELQNRKAELEAGIAALAEQASALYTSLEKMQYGNLAYRANEIVLATVMDGGMPEDRTRAQLLKFLEDADREAMKRGAKNEGRDSALTLGSEDYFFQTAQVISQSEGKVVIRVKSLYNSLIGEPVLVYFELAENQRLYKKGEVIASREIDAGPEGNAENEILALLAEVSSELVNRGMITDKDGSVGKIISGEEFLKALALARQASGKVLAIVRADEDIWTAVGPPKVNLTIEKPDDVEAAKRRLTP